MPVKIYLKDQIFRLSKLPEDLQSLFAYVKNLVKQELPSSWTIQYLDSEGDHIVVSHDQDFKELVEMERSILGSTLKLYIVPTQGISVLQEKTENNVSAEEKKEQEKSNKSNSQTEPKDNELNDSLHFHKAKKLVKFMVAKQYFESLDSKFEKELEEIQAILTEEEKASLERKREKFLESIPARYEHWGEGHHAHHAQHRWRRMRKCDHKSEEEEDSSKGFDIFTFVKFFKKVVKARKYGNSEKEAFWKEKLLAKVPEQGKAKVESTLASFPENLDYHEMKEKVIVQVREIIPEIFPERKDEMLESLDKMNEKEWHEHRHGHGFAHGHHQHHHYHHRHRYEYKERFAENERFRGFWRGGFRGGEGRGKFGRGWHQGNIELLQKYPMNVIRKAGALNLIFTEEDMQKLCEYVNQKPEQLSMEELVLNYRKKD